jgi:hypothetical protein
MEPYKTLTIAEFILYVKHAYMASSFVGMGIIHGARRLKLLKKD